MRKLFLTLALLGCDADTLRVHVVGPYGEDASLYEGLVSEGVGLLGHRAEVVDSPVGAVTVEIFMLPQGYEGRTLADEKAGCVRVVRSIPDPLMIAHEVGHALSLRHSEDLENLMHPEALTDGLTAEQQDTIDDQVRKLSKC